MTTPPPACTAEQRNLVTEYLRSTGGGWVSSPSDYRVCTRSELAKKLEQVRDAVLLTTNAAPADVETAYAQSLRYVDRSFDFYEGK